MDCTYRLNESFEDQKIEHYNPEFLRDIMRIRENAFGNLDINFRLMRRAARMQNIRLGFINNELAGYIIYFQMSECDYLKQESVDFLEVSRTDKLIKEYRGYYSFVETFDNEFTRESFPINDDDFYFYSLAVDKKYRGNGLGKRLMHKTIEIAKQEGASAVYLNCWCGETCAEQLYLKIGFKPFLKLGPFYSDASSMTAMGIRI